MAKPCCGGVTCGCVLTEGTGVTISGSGTPTDPFEIAADLELEVVDNSTFNLSLVGTGRVDDPYELSVTFAPTAKVADFPDWSDTVATNGQVPVWNSALGQWVPGSGTTAPTGAVSHDSSLDGDGSVGDVLQVRHDPDRFTMTWPSGVGLDDVGVNQLVRHFPSSAERATADPAPVLNTLSMLDTAPGKVDYWTGAAWAPIEDLPTLLGGSAFLQLSGAYAGGRVHRIIKRLSVTTGPDGSFAALAVGELVGYAGVLSVELQETGTLPYKAMLSAGVGEVTGMAYRLDTGAVYPAQPIEGIVVATVY